MSSAISSDGVFSGFENISRFWDSRHNSHVVKVKPGEYYVSARDEPITTTLGSCIAVCVRDVRRGFGGMNHFMLPVSASSSDQGGSVSGSARYGNFAMEHLINTLLSHGSHRSDLEFKVFGAGAVLRNDTLVGESNIRFLRTFMSKEGYRISSEDLGGAVARRVMYFPVSGRALVKHLDTNTSVTNEIIREEESHRKSLNTRRQVMGDVELF